MRNSLKRSTRLISLPNADAPAADGLTPTLNAVAMPAGDVPPEWLSVPYADVPYNVNGVTGLQRLNRTIAERLVNSMGRAMRIDPRLASGLPFYDHGHPDFFDVANADELTKWLQNQPPAVGWIREFNAAPNALQVRVEWNDVGRDLIKRKHYKSWSPFFRSEKMAVETVNGLSVQIYEPRLIQSAGLTNTPNWPMPPMVNAAILNGGETTEGSMNLLQRLIALLGDATVTDDDGMVSAMQKLIDACKSLKDSVDAKWKAEDAARMALPNAADPFALATGYVAHLEGSLLAAQVNAAGLVTAQALAETLQGQLKTTRTEFATHLVAAAVSRGAVLQGHAESRIADMVNAGDAFMSKAAELGTLPKLMKTETETANVGSRSTDVADRRTRFHEMVNAAMQANSKLSYDAAFAAVAQKHPELIASPA